MRPPPAPSASATFAEGWIFLALAVGLSSLIWSGLFLVDPANNPWAGGSSMSGALVALFLGGGAVPSLLGLLFAFRRGRWAACVAVLSNAVPHAKDGPLVLVALTLPITAAMLARLAGHILGVQSPAIDLSALPRAAAMAVAAALMEEFGWRGMALPALCRRLSLAHSGLMVGLAWGLWHTVGAIWSVAPFFDGWFAAYYLTGILGTMAGAGLTLAAIWHGADARLFPVLVFHSAFSASATVLTPSTGDPGSAVVVATCFAVAHTITGWIAVRWARARMREAP